MGEVDQVASQPDQVVGTQNKLVAPPRDKFFAQLLVVKFFSSLRMVFLHIHKFFFIHRSRCGFFIVTVDGNGHDPCGYL